MRLMHACNGGCVPRPVAWPGHLQLSQALTTKTSWNTAQLRLQTCCCLVRQSACHSVQTATCAKPRNALLRGWGCRRPHQDTALLQANLRGSTYTARHAG